MQRTAILILCAGVWTSNASAAPCELIGDVVGGFSGGATSYGIIRNLGKAPNWVSAGLYGAGVTFAVAGGRAAGQAACENFSELIHDIAAIYCIAGEYLCEDIEDVTKSLLRDFQICSSCSVGDVLGAFLVADSMREYYLQQLQRRYSNFSVDVRLRALPRDHIGPLNSAVLDYFYAGQQAGFSLLTMTSMQIMPK